MATAKCQKLDIGYNMLQIVGGQAALRVEVDLAYRRTIPVITQPNGSD
jgi:hypothetical protein